jgi:hypothetical protein
MIVFTVLAELPGGRGEREGPRREGGRRERRS